MRRRIAFLALITACTALVASLAPPSALAQGEPNIMRWWVSAPAQANAPTRAYVPRQRAKAPMRPRHESDATLGLHMPDIAVTIPVIADENRPVVGLIGDSLAEALGFGFEADTGFKADFLLRQKTSSASGLVRDDFLDWSKTAQAFLAENKAMTALVVMIGLNDRQILKKDAETFEPLSEGWRGLYRARLDAILALAREAKVPVIWVGLPVMRLPKLSTDLMQINEMTRERVMAAGQTFVDIAEPFAGSDGKFSLTGPDLIGDIVRLRGPDGIHFTPAGQRKLAFFVERPLRRMANERAGAVAARQAIPLLPLEPGVMALGEPGAMPVQPAAIALPLPPSFALPSQEMTSFAPLMRARPDIGEARQLSERRTAERLVGGMRTNFDETTSRDLFDRGVAPAARSGRSDDFSWR